MLEQNVDTNHPLVNEIFNCEPNLWTSMQALFAALSQLLRLQSEEVKL